MDRGTDSTNKYCKLMRTSWTMTAAGIFMAAFFVFFIIPFASPASGEGCVYGATLTYQDTDADKSDPPELSSTADEYVIQGGGDGSRKKTSGYFYVPENTGSDADPVKITLSDVNISQEDEDPGHSFITIGKGSHVLIKLQGSNFIIAGKSDQIGSDDGMAAIHITKGAGLKITSADGDGSERGYLRAEGGGGDYGGAGIGTRYNEDCGDIVIAGGKINAYGGRSAAAIGGGRDGDAEGDITITGGNVTAHGGEYASGIGSGNHVGVSSNDGGDLRGSIFISGGVVNAYGGRGGAGIGSSDEGKFYGSVIISGGSVTAEGGSLAPGIGCGNDASFHDDAEVRISGGSVNARGGVTAAGIGGGCETNGTKVVIDQEAGKELNITAAGGEHGAGIGSSNRNLKSVYVDLKGGVINASGGENGAGIGSGESTNALYTANAHDIEICGTGTIVAHGGRNGAGIGAGNDSETVGTFSISGDSGGADKRGLDITAVASYGRNEGSDDKPAEYENEAAAIGSGKASGADISISNAVLHTKADCQGADIGGGGYHIDPSGAVGNITIENCSITSASTHKVAPGIGAGYGGTVHNISIKDSSYTGGGIGGAPMDWNYTNLNDVHSISIDNCHIEAVWDEKNPGKFVGNLIPTDGPLDHGAAGIGSGQYGDMDEITITDSYILTRGYGSGAGIGGGGAGGSNYSMIPVKKLDIGDTHSISISNSTVTAYSGCAKLTDYGPVDLWDGYTHYRIELAKFGGGAGIGSGSASSCTRIEIHDCDKVYAKGYKGSGIGGGCGTGIVQSGGADHIILENIGKLEACGGEYCAGIGSGGGDGLRTLDGSVVSEIYIANCPDVRAESGNGAAGIGLGSASKYKSGGALRGEQPITIIDSNIEAKAGPMGAGIGGGFENKMLGIGGENPPILIKGKCRIDAYGGDYYYYEDGSGSHGGGAGIGGGSGAGCSTVIIDIDEDPDKAGFGEMWEPARSGCYVHAVGGGGAAGIGSGGDRFQTTSPDISSSDADTITIKQGAVFAQGGDGYDAAKIHEVMDIYMGAGAGIGGGSGGSKVRYVTINGGFIMAKAGEKASPSSSCEADDIGVGGNRSNVSDRKGCDELMITDGTVLADRFGSFNDKCIVSGGSIAGIINNAVNTGGTRVYRTTIKSPDHSHERARVKTWLPYNTEHIYIRYLDPEYYGSSGKWLYLYLPEKSSEENCVTEGVIETDDAQWADITLYTDGVPETRHCYGWTDNEHKGRLKLEGRPIDAEIRLAEGRDEVRYGDDFRIELADNTMSQGDKWFFSASGAASLDEDGSDPYSIGAYAAMHADSGGSFSFHGVTDSTRDADMYWGSVANVSGTVRKAAPAVSITENLTKVYDSETVHEPSVRTDSGGALSYEWYTASGVRLDAAPKNAGDYKVVAKVAESSIFEEGSDESEFSIIPAEVSVKQSAAADGAAVSLGAEAFGLFGADKDRAGSIRFTVTAVVYEDGVPKTAEDGSVITTAKEFNIDLVYSAESGRYLASLSSADTPEGDYSVTAEYVPECSDYTAGEADELEYHKGKAIRSIDVSDHFDSIYGAESFSLGATASSQRDTDEWKYSVIEETGSNIMLKKSDGEYEAIGHCVTVSDEGRVSVHHAGCAVIEIKLEDKGGSAGTSFEDAYAYVRVNVAKAPLSVESYAYKGAGTEARLISDAVYGKLSSIAYGIRFGEGQFRNGDMPDTFTHGLGTLAAARISDTSPASDDAYQIGIEKNGVDIRILAGDQEYDLTGAFISRDYDISYTYGTLKVKKASLAVKVDDAAGVYGGEEPDYSWHIPAEQGDCDGLAVWDSADTVFSTEPQIGLKLSEGASYKSLDAGDHKGIIGVTGKAVSANYAPVFTDGNLRIIPADISDGSRFSIEADDTVYNGLVQKQEITVTDSAFGSGADKKVLIGNRDYITLYPDDKSMIHAGTVRVKVSAKEGGNYSGSGYASYRIDRASLLITTGSASKVWDGEALTQPEVDVEGLAGTEKLTAKAVGTITDVGSVPNSCEIAWDGTAQENDYAAAIKTGTLTVLPKKGRNSITAEGYTGVYDSNYHYVSARALIDGSTIEYSTDGGNTWTEEAPGFRGASDEAHKVQIRAYHPAYVNEGRAEAETEVVITPAPVVTGQTAVISDEGRTCTVTAVVTGLYEAVGKVRFSISGPGLSPVIIEKDVGYDGEWYTASVSHTSENAPAGDYTVTVSYIPPADSDNYLESPPDEETYDKKPDNRTITVSSINASYGDKTAVISPSASDPLANDIWSYELVSWSGSGIKDKTGAPIDAVTGEITLREDGSAETEILHAGEAVIKVTLRDGSEYPVYNDASAYVRISISKKALAVRSYAYRDGAVASGLRKLLALIGGTSEAVYGELDSVKYGLEFDGLADGDTEDTVTHGMGTLSAVLLAVDSDAMDDPYPILIAKNGVDLSIGEKEYSGVFISRDYELQFKTGGLRVLPADLNDKDRFDVAVSDTAYNGKVQKQSVRVSDRAFGSDPAKVLREGNDYTVSYPEDDAMRDAGNVIAEVRGIEAGNYMGTVNAECRITKAPLTVITESASKKYDGRPLTAGGSVSGFVAGENAKLVVTGSRTMVGTSPNTYRLEWTGRAKEKNYQTEEKLGMLTVTKADEDTGGNSKDSEKDNKNEKSSSKGSGGIGTGDSTVLSLWIVLFTCSAILLTVMFIRSFIRRRRD